MIYFKNSSTDPYFNLALEECLIKSSMKDDIFLLWQNDNTIVIGRNQNTIQEINLKQVEVDHVNVVRRLSGGGTVYHDTGNLNFTFIMNRNADNAKSYALILEPIINVLQKLGLNARFAGKNDIEINEKKISGSAQYVYKNRLLHHGTILFDVDLLKLGQYLNVDPAKIISKGIKSIPARVTNILPLLNDKITITSLIDFIVNELVQQGSIIAELPPKIIEQANELAVQKFRTWDWNYGNSPASEYTYKVRYEGKGTIEVKLNIVQGIIVLIKIYGDFLGYLGTEQLEQQLLGAKYDYQVVKKILKQNNFQEIFGQKFTIEDILDVIVH